MRTCGGSRRRRSPRLASTDWRSAAPWGGTRRRCGRCCRFTAPLLPEEAPKHLLGIGEVDDLLAGIALGLDVFDCAVPTRLARHGVALAPDPEHRFRLDLRKSGWEGDRAPLVDGCPCPACRHHDRDYISYLSRAEELTAVRLICLHNLTYMHELTTHARSAITAGTFSSYATNILAGKSPWAAADPSSST